MDDLLQNPAIQAGIAPFVLALPLAFLLARTKLLGLAQLAGFLVLAGLAIGFSFESLTALKKLVLLAVGSGVAVLVLELLPVRSSALRWAVLALLAGGCIWMLWRLLAQKESTAAAVLTGAVAVAYVAALAGSMLHISKDPVGGASAGLMIGLGTGAVAILGASAVLGSATIAVGAAAGATLLAQMVRGQAPAGTSVSLPAATVTGLAGVLATQSAVLPWYCLLPILAAPWATRLVSPERLPKAWVRAFACSALALIPMLVAIALAWALPQAAAS